MKNIWRVVVVLLSFGILLALPGVCAATLEFDVNQKSTGAETLVNTELLEKQATEYVIKYIENTYLYKSNDLSEGTILAAAEGTVAIDALGEQLQVNDTSVCVTDLCENIAFLEDIAEYYKYIRSAQDFQRYDFTVWSSVCDTQVNGNSARVNLYAEVSFRYDPMWELSAAGDHYLVEFVRVNDQWLISNVAVEDLVVSGLTKETFHLQEKLASADIALAAIAESKRTAGIVEDEAAPPAAEIQSTISTWTPYNKNNAVAYAYVYTTSSYTNDSGNDTSFMNQECFGDYSSVGGNCQNFASQCVWAGLGGSNREEDVKAQKFPMDTQGTYRWHNFGNGVSHTTSWTFARYSGGLISMSMLKLQTTQLAKGDCAP